MIENAFIRLINGENNQEMCRYDLKESYDGMLAMVFGEVYRHDGEWKFNPIGQATKDPSLKELVNRYV
jgi:stress response protein SCP2